MSNKSWPVRFLVTVKSILDVPFWPKLIRQRNRFDRIENWSELVPTVCTRVGLRCLFANQHPAEIGGLCEAVRKLKPRVVVEIGTSKGDSVSVIAARGTGWHCHFD